MNRILQNIIIFAKSYPYLAITITGFTFSDAEAAEVSKQLSIPLVSFRIHWFSTYRQLFVCGPLVPSGWDPTFDGEEFHGRLRSTPCLSISKDYFDAKCPKCGTFPSLFCHSCSQLAFCPSCDTVGWDQHNKLCRSNFDDLAADIDSEYKTTRVLKGNQKTDSKADPEPEEVVFVDIKKDLFKQMVFTREPTGCRLWRIRPFVVAKRLYINLNSLGTLKETKPLKGDELDPALYEWDDTKQQKGKQVCFPKSRFYTQKYANYAALQKDLPNLLTLN